MKEIKYHRIKLNGLMFDPLAVDNLVLKKIVKLSTPLKKSLLHLFNCIS